MEPPVSVYTCRRTALAPLGLGQHTDHYGHFHASALPSGFYVLEATLPTALLLPSTIYGQQSLTVSQSTSDGLQVFSGGKFLLSEAIPIEVHEAETRYDADLTLPTVGLPSLRINVVAEASGSAIPRGHLQLCNAADKSVVREAEFRGGTAVVNYVPNGSYILTVSAEQQAQAGRSMGRFIASSMPLLVESDAPEITIALAQVR